MQSGWYLLLLSDTIIEQVFSTSSVYVRFLTANGYSTFQVTGKTQSGGFAFIIVIAVALALVVIAIVVTGFFTRGLWLPHTNRAFDRCSIFFRWGFTLLHLKLKDYNIFDRSTPAH